MPLWSLDAGQFGLHGGTLLPELPRDMVARGRSVMGPVGVGFLAFKALVTTLQPLRSVAVAQCTERRCVDLNPSVTSA
ncbi:hypothetical protein DSL92_08565 [Billgrantia gudaonensis]|uniref:Uncharacterized protein n=1 Tax=Billgrantia gudaonensis TaxID=376427 RepID=A0A3S0NWI6_9GAMM|nr:hypothetical protein DSL92_08565 [Halomonas gudaonensis]